MRGLARQRDDRPLDVREMIGVGLESGEGKMKRKHTEATRFWVPSATTLLIYLFFGAVLFNARIDDDDAAPVSLDGTSSLSLLSSVGERMAVSGVLAAQASTPGSAIVHPAKPSPEPAKVNSIPPGDHLVKPEVAMQTEAETGAVSLAGKVVATEAETVPEFLQVQSEAPSSAVPAMDGLPGVRVTESVFVPPLVTTVGPNDADDFAVDPALPLPDSGEGPLSSEMLRIIAKMTPEQIDALTLLLMSHGGSQPAGVLPEENVADAPWIGDWNDSEVAGEDAAETKGASENVLDPPWQLIEEADGSVYVEVPGDAFSRVRMEPGLVLGSSGVVINIRKTEGEVLVFLSGGRRIAGQRHPTAVANYIAQRAIAAERSKGDTRMEVVSAAVNGQESRPRVEGREAALAGAPEEMASSTKPDTDMTGQGWIQAGSFREQSNAKEAETLLYSNGFEVVVLKGSPANGGWYVVRAQSKDPDLRASLEDIRALGFADAYLIDRTGGTKND